MPLYCDTCESVIDRAEELTRLDGHDYCLKCTPPPNRYLTKGDRLEEELRLLLLDWLQRGDPNGCYTDGHARAEGMEPATLPQALAQVLEYTAPDPDDSKKSDLELAYSSLPNSDWCSCPDSEPFTTTFYDDGEHPNLHKHHYRCNDCNGITQIG